MIAASFEKPVASRASALSQRFLICAAHVSLCLLFALAFGCNLPLSFFLASADLVGAAVIVWAAPK